MYFFYRGDDDEDDIDIVVRSKNHQQHQRPRQPNGVPGRRVHYDDDARVDRHPVTGAYHTNRGNPSRRDNLNSLNRRSPATRTNYDPPNDAEWASLAHRSPLLEPVDRHAIGNVSPTSKANFRRSPSYVSAISESPNSEHVDLQNRTRVYDGKLYFGVDSSDSTRDVESEF